MFKNQNLSFNKINKKLKINDGHSSSGAKNSEFKKKISGALDLFTYSISEHTIEEIRNFNPTLIYSNLGSNRIINLCSSLGRELNIPIVPHFLDDWLSIPNVHSFSFINYLLFRNINKNIVKLIGNS